MFIIRVFCIGICVEKGRSLVDPFLFNVFGFVVPDFAQLLQHIVVTNVVFFHLSFHFAPVVYVHVMCKYAALLCQILRGCCSTSSWLTSSFFISVFILLLLWMCIRCLSMSVCVYQSFFISVFILLLLCVYMWCKYAALLYQILRSCCSTSSWLMSSFFISVFILLLLCVCMWCVNMCVRACINVQSFMCVCVLVHIQPFCACIHYVQPCIRTTLRIHADI